MNKNIEIISLIYKSPAYLDFILNQLKNNCDVEGWDVSFRIVANDPTPQVIDALSKLDKKNYAIYNDKNPTEYYINRVYRCYNWAVETSTYDNVCLINSDMAFSKDWLSNLLKHHDGKNIPCSRLVESGKLHSGQYGIMNYFGHTPSTMNYMGWRIYANSISENITHVGGLFMPVVFEKDRFLDAGGYPEGNIYQDGIGTYNPAKFVKSGDEYFFKDILENNFGMKHITVFDSLVYHFQEGEKSE